MSEEEDDSWKRMLLGVLLPYVVEGDVSSMSDEEMTHVEFMLNDILGVISLKLSEKPLISVLPTEDQTQNLQVVLRTGLCCGHKKDGTGCKNKPWKEYRERGWDLCYSHKDQLSVIYGVPQQGVLTQPPQQSQSHQESPILVQGKTPSVCQGITASGAHCKAPVCKASKAEGYQLCYAHKNQKSGVQRVEVSQ